MIMNNIEKYEEIIRKCFELEGEENVTDLVRGQGNWDSLGHMNLVEELEDAYNIMIDIEDIVAFTSYSAGIDILKKYGVEI